MVFRMLILILATSLFAGTVFCQQNIRDVDLRNFTYSAHCAGADPEDVTVKDDEFYEEKKEEDFVDRFFFKVIEVSYGDLTGDGREEAVVITVCNTGGTGNFTEGFVFGISSGKAMLLARIAGGDRAYGGLRSASVEEGTLVVETNDAGEFGGACCPEAIITTKYKVSGGKLVQTGKPERKELYPAERLSFPKGSRGTSFTISLEPGDRKRYVVEARTGQSLKGEVDTDKASVRLLDNIPFTEGINNFLARLPKTGDYTIEIENVSEDPLEVLVNIRID
ncbi:MAG TPA: hypothetical protein PKD24_06380 [Pyrinomonadaceae bacterium]|nr:hypothetical protein [Pyrinomonadaceae bacterium]HMP65216.1 hypothetical protein [Pyrinomonadaceae bacterium]